MALRRERLVCARKLVGEVEVRSHSGRTVGVRIRTIAMMLSDQCQTLKYATVGVDHRRHATQIK